MTTTTPTLTPDTTPNPREVFLKAQNVFDRYGWRKSAGYERFESPGFPSWPRTAPTPRSRLPNAVGTPKRRGGRKPGTSAKEAN